jgi:large subunit ribosomal protein L18e
MKFKTNAKKSTRELLVALEKQSKASKSKVWTEIASRLSKSTRGRIKVNLWELSKVCKNGKDKTFIVPGKVLGTGELSGAVEVAAFSFSENAKKKIAAQKGTAMNLRELLEKKPKPSSMVIIG